MERRDLIKILGVAAVGLVTVPWWIESWTDQEIPENAMGMKEDQLILLNTLVGSIIPRTEIPGAIDLKVDNFVITMVSDCYEKSVADEFLSGFAEIEAASEELYNRSYGDLSEDERVFLLTDLAEKPKPENKKIIFVKFLKDLTVTGFMTSEYVQVNHLNYEMIPARFNGSYPVSESIYKNV